MRRGVSCVAAVCVVKAALAMGDVVVEKLVQALVVIEGKSSHEQDMKTSRKRWWSKLW